MRILNTVLLVALLGAAVAADERERYAGRSLADALQLLQHRGLRIVYSSAVVSAEMRVRTEPRSPDAERALVELLRPHGLAAKPGPGGVLQIVRAPRERAGPDAKDALPQARPAPPPEIAPPPAYDEAVFVQASAEARRDSGVAAQSTLDHDVMQLRGGTLESDPLFAMHSMPRVASSDDFRGEFSVRGSPYRHLGVVIDGVATPLLQHAAFGAGDTASMAMLNPDVIDHATLQVGAYPRRFGDRLGGQLAMTLREGSRQRTAVSGSLAGVAAAIVGEGPLRLSDSDAARGSWLVSARQSFLDFPTTRFGAEYAGMGFSFRDVQAKVVYDLTPSQQVSGTLVAGQTNAEQHDLDAMPGGVLDGRHRAGLMTVAWRSTLGSATALTQRVHAIASNVWNRGDTGAVVGEARQREVAYRSEIAHAWSTVFLEAGADVQRLKGRRAPTFRTSAWQRAGYVHAAWTPSPGLTIAPGIRVGSSTLAARAAASPWLLTEWTWKPGWTLVAAAGLGHQFPGPDEALWSAMGRPAAAERARYVDVGVERTIARGVRVQATLFDRAERNVRDWASNTLTGQARGAEVLIERAASAGVSGSVAYSFGRARYTDTETSQRFWADFDQRHALNAFASYRWSRVTVAAAFRSGSNFPIAGYLLARDGSLFAGDERNVVRQRPYARLDAQATRSFLIGGRGLTLYVELLNALNRTNYGPGNGVIRSGGEAVGFTEKLLPRFLTGGLRIDF